MLGFKIQNLIQGQANYSKRRITVVLRTDTPKHVSNEPKMQNWYVVDISNQFFLNWLFSWGFGKGIFSQNWKEEWNKEICRSKKKFYRLKLKLYFKN